MFTLPAATPATVPEVPTVAIAVLPLLHVPPDVASARDIVATGHTFVVPVMEDGSAFTVSIAVTVVVPQALVTV